MVKTYESRFPPSPNLGKVTVSFDKLNNSYLFLQIHEVYIVHTFSKGTQDNYSTLMDVTRITQIKI